MEKTIEMKGVDLGMLFGPADAKLKLVEDAFASKIIVRGNIIKIDGDKKEVVEEPCVQKEAYVTTDTVKQGDSKDKLKDKSSNEISSSEGGGGDVIKSEDKPHQSPNDKILPT